MKFGFRGFSPKRSIAASLSVKRYIRHSMGLKVPRGFGWLTDPKKAAYNRIYNRTTFGLRDIFHRRRMPKKKNVNKDENGANAGLGCFLVLGIVCVGVLWQQKTMYGVIALVVWLVFAWMTSGSDAEKQEQCEVCGNPTRGTIYKWNLKGKETQVCSKCNQQLERRQSKQAVDKFLDDK